VTDNASSRPVEAEFREYALGNLPDQKHRDVHPIVGLIPNADVRQYVMFAAETYDPDDPMYDGKDMPRDFWSTKYAQEIKRKYGTEVGTEALRTGNITQLSYFSGLVGYQKDVSGMQTLMQLQQLIENAPVFIAYIYGLMGSGKSNFALLLLEVFASVYGEDNVYRCANITSESIDEEITSYTRMVEILEDRRERIQNGESLDELVMLIDEAAQLFSGSGKDQHRAKQLAKILKLARKSAANVILIGQDGKDIGPSLRALCTAFIEKQSQKKAVFWQDVMNRQGVGEMMRLEGVPETSLDWSTWDEGEFEFPDNDGDDSGITEEDIRELEREHEREMMAILHETTDMTHPEIAELYDVSEKTSRRAKKKYESELEELGV